MKKPLLSLLIILPIYFTIQLYYLDKDYFLCPVRYKREVIIRSDNRGDGFFAAERSGNRLHQGVDLFVKIGEPVYASRSGKVIEATTNHGMGNFIKIAHTENIITLYGHLSRILVTKNQFVQQGEVIGLVGKTGNANLRDIQPHLHFEVRKNGFVLDPMEYLE